MKFFSFTFLFVLLSQFLIAQTNWMAIENELTAKREQKKISSKEWYSLFKYKAGHLGSFSLWVDGQKTVKSENIKKGVQLYFPNNFQLIASNGNKYTKVYLENNTNDSIGISRIDATLANVQEHFFINGKWIPFRKNQTSTCGNSYFNDKLAPNHRLDLCLDNEVLTEGKNPIKYKIAIIIDKSLIESNVITIRLHDSQVKRILESLSVE